MPLFDRVGRRVTLTDAGRRLLGYAEKMLELEEETRAAVSANGEPAGTVTISAAETHCTYRLPGCSGGPFPATLSAGSGAYPAGAGRRTFCGDTDRCETWVRGKADVAFVLDKPVQATGLAADSLVEEPVWLVAAPDHRLAASPPVRPDDLRDETLLLTGAGCSYRAMFLDALARDGVHPKTLLEFSGVEAIKQCAIAGNGRRRAARRRRYERNRRRLPCGAPLVRARRLRSRHADDPPRRAVALTRRRSVLRCRP